MKTFPQKMHGSRRERGVVLLFCLVILVVLLAGGVAVVRSTNSSLFSAGNLSFRRDLVNQGELAISQAMRAFQVGGLLASTADTSAHKPAANYSAIQLVSNPRGIPEVLLKKNTLTGPDVSGGTFAPTGAAIDGAGNVSVRYVIDRMCNATGTFAVIGTGACVSDLSAQPTGGDASHLVEGSVSLPSPPIYRVTVRVDGPRDTQVFLQASFTKPE